MSEGAVLRLVSELAERYRLPALRPLLDIYRDAAGRADLSVAVLGRFKAGKSSFLNSLFGRPALPVGVIPVTSVVTTVEAGAPERAVIRWEDGGEKEIALEALHEYIAEAENPSNRKRVRSAHVFLPTLNVWRPLRFVDTPGLESVFVHNSETAMAWAPNVEMALVAIGVDPPLTRQDLELIEALFNYTPQVAVLLTKADLVGPEQLADILAFVRTRLRARFDREIAVLPYSTHPEFEALRKQMKEQLLQPLLGNVAAEREAIRERKRLALARACETYLAMAQQSAELHDGQRRFLETRMEDQRRALAPVKMELRLLARDAATRTRGTIEAALAPDRAAIQRRLLRGFEESAPQWPDRFGAVLDAFSAWLRGALLAELSAASLAHRRELAASLDSLLHQYRRILQDFRDHLADQTEAVFGIALRTAEPAIEPEPPRAPDVDIGRSFDHNWELLSPLLPMRWLRPAVHRRLRQRIGRETYKNLSRLTAQWEAVIKAAILDVEKEAERRLEEQLDTIQSLLSATGESAPAIRVDLERLRSLLPRAGASGKLGE